MGFNPRTMRAEKSDVIEHLLRTARLSPPGFGVGLRHDDRERYEAIAKARARVRWRHLNEDELEACLT